MLSKERHNPRLDGLASELAVGVLGHDAGPDLDFVADLEDTLEDAATGDASLEVIDLGTGLVHVEGSVEEDENKFYPTLISVAITNYFTYCTSKNYFIYTYLSLYSYNYI